MFLLVFPFLSLAETATICFYKDDKTSCPKTATSFYSSSEFSNFAKDSFNSCDSLTVYLVDDSLKGTIDLSKFQSPLKTASFVGYYNSELHFDITKNVPQVLRIQNCSIYIENAEKADIVFNLINVKFSKFMTLLKSGTLNATEIVFDLASVATFSSFYAAKTANFTIEYELPQKSETLKCLNPNSIVVIEDFRNNGKLSLLTTSIVIDINENKFVFDLEGLKTNPLIYHDIYRKGNEIELSIYCLAFSSTARLPSIKLYMANRTSVIFEESSWPQESFFDDPLIWIIAANESEITDYYVSISLNANYIPLSIDNRDDDDPLYIKPLLPEVHLTGTIYCVDTVSILYTEDAHCDFYIDKIVLSAFVKENRPYFSEYHIENNHSPLTVYIKNLTRESDYPVVFGGNGVYVLQENHLGLGSVTFQCVCFDSNYPYNFFFDFETGKSNKLIPGIKDDSNFVGYINDITIFNCNFIPLNLQKSEQIDKFFNKEIVIVDWTAVTTETFGSSPYVYAPLYTLNLNYEESNIRGLENGANVMNISCTTTVFWRTQVEIPEYTKLLVEKKTSEVNTRFCIKNKGSVENCPDPAIYNEIQVFNQIFNGITDPTKVNLLHLYIIGDLGSDTVFNFDNFTKANFNLEITGKNKELVTFDQSAFTQKTINQPHIAKLTASNIKIAVFNSTGWSGIMKTDLNLISNVEWEESTKNNMKCNRIDSISADLASASNLPSKCYTNNFILSAESTLSGLTIHENKVVFIQSSSKSINIDTSNGKPYITLNYPFESTLPISSSGDKVMNIKLNINFTTPEKSQPKIEILNTSNSWPPSFKSIYLYGKNGIITMESAFPLSVENFNNFTIKTMKNQLDINSLTVDTDVKFDIPENSNLSIKSLVLGNYYLFNMPKSTEFFVNSIFSSLPVDESTQPIENIKVSELLDINIGSSITVNNFDFLEDGKTSLDFEYRLSGIAKSRLNRKKSIISHSNYNSQQSLSSYYNDEEMILNQPKEVIMSYTGESEAEMIKNNADLYANLSIELLCGQNLNCKYWNIRHVSEIPYFDDNTRLLAVECVKKTTNDQANGDSDNEECLVVKVNISGNIPVPPTMPPFTQTASPDDGGGDSSNGKLAVILGSVFGVIGVAIILVLVFVVVKLKKHNQELNKQVLLSQNEGTEKYENL